ncbi:MAG: hypothetical protein ACQEXK_16240 [Bacillota bacterium]
MNLRYILVSFAVLLVSLSDLLVSFAVLLVNFHYLLVIFAVLLVGSYFHKESSDSLKDRCSSYLCSCPDIFCISAILL